MMLNSRLYGGAGFASRAGGVVGAAADPDVTFDWDFFPFMDTLREAVGGVLAVVLVIDVAVLVLCAIAWAAGRIAGSRGIQQASAIGMLIAVGVAAIIGGANALVRWGANVDLGF
ncbi:Integral membrane protein [Occultella aeris]|uniref:Integral membrane protein n=1 Tax=Occultella aeris TaxID=2761496 RepID=A0A7M4DKS0_9MICO|nr:hypothetical protein HALOF300_02734 [Occultella aeris]